MQDSRQNEILNLAFVRLNASQLYPKAYSERIGRICKRVPSEVYHIDHARDRKAIHQ
jgi:hypothetical protein